MSKQNYAVCCYTCEHNGQETCKGCNTILNGENEPYENWQLREDLCRKDKQIADLQHKLEVAEKALEIQNKSLEKCEQWLWEDEELLDNYEDAGGSVCHTFYQPIEHFKEQAEAEINKRSNNNE